MIAGPGTRLSEIQESVVSDRRPRVLVSAGAGSGKTRLLVAYFVRALMDEGISAERLVAVTFTRKAAAELADRIRSELQLLGRADLAWSLDAATIGTIHSLCRRLIKDRALEAGVDPACKVLEAEAAALVNEEVGREAWAHVVEGADDIELEVLASGRDGLRRQIGPLYERLRGLGYESPQISIAPGPPTEAARARLVGAIGRALAAAKVLDRCGAALGADLERLRACLAWLEEPWSDGERAARMHETAGFFPSRRTRSMEGDFEPVREALRGYRQALAEVRLRPLVVAVNHLLAEFHRRYEIRKRERGVVDFADLELRARALVSGSGKASGYRSAQTLPGSWVLVDEFQDTNELQCSILEGLGAARLLMVGDHRQSIYRFRGADVRVFVRREDELRSRAHDDPEGALYRLDTNYRSRPEILDFINRLFAHSSHFGKGFQPLLSPVTEGELAAAQGAALPSDVAWAPRSAEPAPAQPAAAPVSAQAGQPAGALSPLRATVEVLVAERTAAADPAKLVLTMQEAEAGVVAGRARALVIEEGYSQRDIVVLLPANTYVDVYRRALLSAGLQVYVVRGKGYYSQEEVADVVSLLRLLVNPHDDLAMVAALRSPMGAISDDALYHLGRERGRTKRSLWDVIRDGSTKALSDDDRLLLDTFAGRLRELRRAVGRPGLARLIDDAVDLCAYDLCLLASPDGTRRFANVRKLMRMARDFEELEGPNLAGFVALVESMGDLSDQEGSAPTLAEGDDVVRVMTIHQAKGLEFPAVVLAGLGSDVFHGQTSDVVLGEDGRMGVFLKGSRHPTYEPHDLCWGPAGEIVAQDRERENEEDVRLLYVAMTRAQERLILVGARPAGNRLEGSRIGRTIAGLGLECPPPQGTSVTLEGLEAIVASAAVPDTETTPVSVPTHAGVFTETSTPPRTLAAAAGVPAMEAPAAEVAAGATASEAPAREDRPETPPDFLEARRGVDVPRHASFSALAAYLRCPRRFYLERVLGLDLQAADPDDGDDAEQSPARDEVLLDPDERQTGRDVGLLVHALLERIPFGCGRPSEDHVRREAGVWLRQSGIDLAPADVDRAVALTLGFWDSPSVEHWSHPAAEREAPFFFARGDILVSGVMDLVLRDGDCWYIVDYKTNSLVGRTPAEVASGYELQATVYCLAALLAGAPAVQMDFVFLESPAEPQTRPFDRGDMPRLVDALDAVLDRLRLGEFAPETGDECLRCPSVTVCTAMARA